MERGDRGADRPTGVIRVVVVYALFAGLWILLSDRAVGLLFTDPEAMVTASMVKGWLFVAVTSLLLYLLVARLVSTLQLAHLREIDALESKRRSLNLLGAIIDNSDDAIFAKDLNGRYLLFNAAASRLVGKSVSEVLGRDDSALFPAAQARHLMDADRRVTGGGRVETYEEVLDTTAGPRVFLATKGPLRDAETGIFGVFGISRDITERKRLETELRDNEARLRLLSEHAPVALALFDREMRYVTANRRWRDQFRLGERNLVGVSHYEVFPELPEKWREMHRRGLQGEAQASESDQFRRKDGSMLWTRWLVHPWHAADGTVGGIVIFVEDITARKQAEWALHESEHRFRDIAEASADWIWEVDAQARYTYASEGVEAMLGYAPSDVLGKTPFDLMPADEAARVRAEFEAIAARKAVFRNLDNINLHKDGSRRHVQTTGIPILGADGELLGYRGLDRDVTEAKKAESTLRQLAEELQATLQAIPDLLFELDAEGRYLAVKATREALLAAPAEGLPGRTVHDVLPPQAATTLMDALAVAGREGFDFGRIIDLPLPQGLMHFELSVARKPSGAGEAARFIVVPRDITARKRAEEELRERNAELERFNKASIGREMDVIAMKIRINALCEELGRPRPYPLEFLKNQDQGTSP